MISFINGGGAVFRGRRPSRLLDDGDFDAVRYVLPFLDQDFPQDSCERRRHLGVDLVGDDFEERLVQGNLVTHQLQPLSDRPLGYALAELGHGHLGHKALLFRDPSRRACPKYRHSPVKRRGNPSLAHPNVDGELLAHPTRPTVCRGRGGCCRPARHFPQASAAAPP